MNEVKYLADKKVREKLKEHGICVRCRHADAQPGKVHCLECGLKNTERARAYYWRKKGESKC